MIVHVTSIRDGGVYGHTMDHCDDAGCAGDEFYFPSIPAEDTEVGDLYEIEEEQ